MAFSVFALLGPGELSFRRAADMLDSFWAYCDPKEDIDLYLINDNSKYLSELKPWLEPFRHTTIANNPLTDKSGNLMDRLTAGTLYALELIEPNCRGYDYILKLDDDALVIGEFHTRLRSFFATHPDAGMIGSYTHFPDGEKRPGNDTWAPTVRKAISGQRIFPELRRYLKGQRPHCRLGSPFKRFLIGKSAIKQNYDPGWHVQGGAYAISVDAVSKVVRTMGDPLIFNFTEVGEDVVLSLLVKSVGLELHNYNETDEVFAVWWRTPTLSADELVNRNYGIVHSIKYENLDDEASVRSFFKKLREPALKCPSGITQTSNKSA